MKTIYLLLAVLLVSCSGEKKDEANSKNDPDPKQTEIDSTQTNLVSKIAGGDAFEAGGEEKEKLQNSLDSIKMTIKRWSDAINIEDVAELDEFYDDRVQFYRRSVRKKDLIASKTLWLESQADYSQTIEIREIQYPAEAQGTIRCLFDKMFKKKNEDQTVRSILELQLIDGRYLITKESDVPTEISLINDEKAQGLPKGKHFFQHDYWLDTRDHEVLAHEFVPYYIGVTIHNSDSFYIEFNSYSGGLREYREYVTKDAVLKDGFLSFKAAPWWYEKWGDEVDLSVLKEEDYQFHKFKILNKNIALVECDGWFEEMVGTRFW